MPSLQLTQDSKRKQISTMYNSGFATLISSMKWANFLKDVMCQNSPNRKHSLRLSTKDI